MSTPQIVKDAAIAMAKEIGPLNIYRKDLCERIGISEGSFKNIMGMSFTDFISSLKSELPASLHGVNKKRISKEQRKDELLDIAMKLSEEKGFNKVTWADLAEAGGVSLGLLVYHFGTIVAFRRTIMRAAISRRNLNILAQGLTIKDEHAKKAPTALKQEAISLLLRE